MSSYREDIYAYAKKKYEAEPEYLWQRYPGYAVLRHKDNAKWFGLIMDLPAERLGLPGSEIVEILNVKLSDAMLTDMLVQQEGFLRGYHISHGNWISILLDGTVPIDEVLRWLDESYLNTASNAEKQKMRPPKEWIVPSNPKYYDIQAAFRDAKEIDWKQGKGIKAGDTVYMYLGAPVSAILYKCEVTKTNIPFKFDEGNVHITSLMKIRLLKQYSPEQFPFEKLKREFGIHAVRGPRGVPPALSEALK
ncbi:MAG: MmcQ/YjbR family DNA-binding protein [Lachnospiraceae bacterium]|nr:MmcQ/YjbR family DNA-binding protein [Lachnospiraceae bacterium]